MSEHVSVMLNEVLQMLEPLDAEHTVVDATLGLAGHTKYILGNCPNAYVIGFDQDHHAREIALENLIPFKGRYDIEADNFRNISKLCDRDNWKGATAVLFDLGVSNLQLTDPERGFSFQNDGPLDMRMDEGEVCNSKITAEEILNEWSIKDMTRIFREYGEEKFSYEIARGIVRNRENGGEIHTTLELVELIRKILPAPVQRKMGGHPARRVFQALRIAVNDEMHALSEALDGALEVLAPGGKIIAISYHSLEDRMVKHRFRKWQEDVAGELSPRKALLPTEEEIERNYKSRSAKLRVFRKYTEEEVRKNVLQRIPT